ncbi:MAG: ABC transporter permease, partial [Deltaproteobacteria bacterium]
MRRRGRSSGIVGRLAALWLLLVTIAALGAPHWAPYPPDAQDLEGRYGSPSAAHWLGQDHLGRDVFSRLLYGARVSLLVGGVTVVLSVGIGLVFGLAAGYYGGWVDQVVMRFIDILMAFPGILLAIALAAVLGPSLRNVIVALSVIGWVGYARLVRGQTLVVKEMEFVAAAR